MKYIIVIAFSFISALALAEPGDTIKISSHDKTHWNWAGSWFDTVQFPDTGSYSRILMHYTLGCPTIGCSEWDYTTRIEISDKINDTTTLWYELVRIITPYAGDKGANWTHEWIIDVTDLAPLFKGERSIAARYSGYQDGFTVSIDFDFIEGTPTREVLAINQLYDGNYRYGFANDPIESHLVPKTIDGEAEMESAKFRMVASGHSFGGNENCAEFCQKFYKLYVNSSSAVQRDVWRDDCGSNPLEAQTGTWIYDRAGWCPGAETMRYDDEIGSYMNAGQSNELNVDWESYNYTGGAGFDPQYTIEALVFQYGPWANAIDAAIDDVLKPSMNDQVWDVNPICNNPEIVVSNQGSEPLTRVEFEYWSEGAPEKLTYLWKGVIFPGKSVQITLPSDGWKLFGGKGKNVFHVQIISANSATDQNEANNHFKSAFDDTRIMPSQFVISISNNSAANETSIRIINDKGENVFSDGAFSAAQVVYDTVSLEPGCYELFIEDSDCDGLNFFANSDGNGKVWLHNADLATFYPPLHMFPSGFGCSTQLNFTVGYALGVEQLTETETALKAYPNPSLGNVLLAVENGFDRGQIELINMNGQLINTFQLTSSNGIELDGLEAGVYTARYTSSKGSATVRFVVIK